MPLPEVSKTITLDKVGAPEFWVKFKRVPGLMYREFMEFNKMGRADIPEEERAMGRFAMLIIDWNIPDRDGNVLPLPSENPEVIFDIPVIFTDHIATEIFDDSEEGGITNLPLASVSETNSPSSSSLPQPEVEEESLSLTSS